MSFEMLLKSDQIIRLYPGHKKYLDVNRSKAKLFFYCVTSNNCVGDEIQGGFNT